MIIVDVVLFAMFFYARNILHIEQAGSVVRVFFYTMWGFLASLGGLTTIWYIFTSIKGRQTVTSAERSRVSFRQLDS